MSPISTEMKVIISASIFKSGPIRNWEFTEGNSHHHFWAYKFKPSSPHLPPLLHKNPSKTATLKNPLWLVQMADPKWTQVDPPDDGCIEAAKWAAGSQQPPLTYMNTSKGWTTKMASTMGLIYTVNYTAQGSDKVDHEYQAFVWKQSDGRMETMSNLLIAHKY